VVLGINSLSSLNNSLNNLVSGPAQRQEMALKLSSELLLLVRAEKDLILAEDDASIKKFDDEIVQERSTIEAQRVRLEAIADPETKAKLAAFNTAYQSFLLVEEKVREFGRHNSNTDAFTLLEKDGREPFDEANRILTEFRDRAQHAEPTAATLNATFLAGRMQTLLVSLRFNDANLMLAMTDETMLPYQKAITAIISDLRGQRDALRQTSGDGERRTFDQLSEQFDKILAVNEKIVVLATQNTIPARDAYIDDRGAESAPRSDPEA
jgi:methyl-accepting chemotaxis protein